MDERITAKEFLKLPETTQPTQLINGKILHYRSQVPKHQHILGNVLRMIDDLKEHGKVYLSPLDVHIDDYNVFQPDIFWVTKHDSCRETPKRMEGMPTLVVEILAPQTRHADTIEKFAIYEKYGLQEYWIIDPETDTVELWIHRDGKLNLIPLKHPNIFVSPTIDKTVILTDVYPKDE